MAQEAFGISRQEELTVRVFVTGGRVAFGFAAAEIIRRSVFGADVGEVVPSQIRYAELAENIIQYRVGELDPVIARDGAGRFKPCKHIGFDELFERDAIL